MTFAPDRGVDITYKDGQELSCSLALAWATYLFTQSA